VVVLFGQVARVAGGHGGVAGLIGGELSGQEVGPGSGLCWERGALVGGDSRWRASGKWAHLIGRLSAERWSRPRWRVSSSSG
jgi:hypothetical protein